MIKIGKVKIKNQIITAPMAGITDSAFRRILKEMGAGLIYGEMVSDKSIYYQSKKSEQLLKMTEKERPIAQQIFGSDIKTLVYAAKYIYQKMKPDIIDLNMGCPVPKVAIKNKAGCALMKEPEKAYKIVKAVVEAVPIPVTVKIRSGWDENNINAVEIALLCEKAGAKAIVVHGRTRKMGYSGKADWQIIKKVKQNVTIPVIGNGDIKTKEDAKRMLEETGCDAVMIGRGLLGNPWLVRDCLAYLENKEIKILSDLNRIETAELHLKYLLENINEKQAILQMRKFSLWYFKKIKNSKDLKSEINKMKTIKDFKKITNQYKERINGKNSI